MRDNLLEWFRDYAPKVTRISRGVGIVCLVGVIFSLSGCVRYTVTLTNGNQITTKGKPRLDPDSQYYRFTDVSGKEMEVPSMRIKAIEAR